MPAVLFQGLPMAFRINRSQRSWLDSQLAPATGTLLAQDNAGEAVGRRGGGSSCPSASASNRARARATGSLSPLAVEICSIIHVIEAITPAVNHLTVGTATVETDLLCSSTAA